MRAAISRLRTSKAGNVQRAGDDGRRRVDLLETGPGAHVGRASFLRCSGGLDLPIHLERQLAWSAAHATLDARRAVEPQPRLEPQLFLAIITRLLEARHDRSCGCVELIVVDLRCTADRRRHQHQPLDQARTSERSVDRDRAARRVADEPCSLVHRSGWHNRRGALPPNRKRRARALSFRTSSSPPQ